VRELLNIPFDGRGVFSNSITIYFHADVARLMEGRNLSVMYIVNPALSGFIRLERDNQSGFLVVNTVADTSKPGAANAAAIPAKRLLDYCAPGIGVEVLSRSTGGRAGVRFPHRAAFSVGRVLSPGTPHVMPPNGGFGGVPV
jgi:hypothetical protein